MTAFLNTARKKSLNRKSPLWSTWRNQWRSCTSERACLGLLHYGLQTEVQSPEEESERLRFYLKLAEGHCPLTPEEYRDSPLTGDEQTIANKAFKVLFDRDFGDVFDKRLLTLPPETIEAILHFFRPRRRDQGSGLENLRVTEGEKENRDHLMKKVNESLLRWCNSIWTRDFTYESEYSSGPIGPWGKNPATYTLVETIRPRILEMLHAYGHGQLEKLVEPVFVYDKDKHPKPCLAVQWELFTPDCMDTLERMASFHSGLVGAHNTGEAVEAALKNGSAAARVLTLLWHVQGHLVHK